MVILKSSDKISIAQIDEGTKEIYRQMSQSRSVVKSLYSSDKFPQTWDQLLSLIHILFRSLRRQFVIFCINLLQQGKMCIRDR